MTLRIVKSSLCLYLSVSSISLLFAQLFRIGDELFLSLVFGAHALVDLSPPFIGKCINSMLDSKVSVHYTRDTDGRTYHIRLSSHFIVRYSRDTDGPTYYIHDSRTILTVYVGLAQARPNNPAKLVLKILDVISSLVSYGDQRGLAARGSLASYSKCLTRSLDVSKNSSLT